MLLILLATDSLRLLHLSSGGPLPQLGDSSHGLLSVTGIQGQPLHSHKNHKVKY